jgi:hypothetical protein
VWYRIPSRHLEVRRGFGLEHAGERCGVVSGQVPVASSVSVWAEEGAERPGVESCLGRACVCVQHQNTLCSFFAVVCRLSMERQESQNQASAASDTDKRRAGGTRYGCLFLSRCCCVALRC